MTSGRRGARWIAAVLGVALVASAVVVYLLIRVTAPSAGGDEGLTAVTSGLSDAAGTTDSAPTPASATGSGSPTAATGDLASSTAGSPPPASGDGPGSPTSAATPPQAPSTTSLDASGNGTSTSGAPTSLLPGSGVPLPSAWSGTAQMDIAVIGDCPAAKPSHFTTPADIAFDVAGAGAPVTSTGATQDADPGTDPTLTIGVNTAAVPSVAVYSAAVDNTGAFHRFWALSVTRSGPRTAVVGTVVDDDALDGNNPNILVDTLKPPAGCADLPVAGLPRVLAVGSTLNGWVDAHAAQFTLKAVTADGQRSLTVTITATRNR